MNALMKLTGGSAYQPSELEMLIMGESTTDENAFDMMATRLHIAPGGTGNFVSPDGAISLRKIDGIVAVSQKARAYWPGKALGKPPICASANGLNGTFNFASEDSQMQEATRQGVVHPAIKLMDTAGSAPETYDCASCPLAQWGSSRGKGQACKSLRRLIIVLDGMAMPIVLTLPPTSVAAWDAYCSSLRQKRSEYFAVRTTFGLERQSTPNGEPYSIVKLESGVSLKIDEVRAVIEVRRQFEDWVRSKAINAEDYTDAAPVEVKVDATADDGSTAQDIPW